MTGFYIDTHDLDYCCAKLDRLAALDVLREKVLDPRIFLVTSTVKILLLFRLQGKGVSKKNAFWKRNALRRN